MAEMTILFKVLFKPLPARFITKLNNRLNRLNGKLAEGKAYSSTIQKKLTEEYEYVEIFKGRMDNPAEPDLTSSDFSAFNSKLGEYTNRYPNLIKLESYIEEDQQRGYVGAIRLEDLPARIGRIKSSGLRQENCETQEDDRSEASFDCKAKDMAYHIVRNFVESLFCGLDPTRIEAPYYLVVYDVDDLSIDLGTDLSVTVPPGTDEDSRAIWNGIGGGDE